MIPMDAPRRRSDEVELFRSAYDGLVQAAPVACPQRVFAPPSLRWTVAKLSLVLAIGAAVAGVAQLSARSAQAAPGWAPALDELISVDGKTARSAGAIYMTAARVPVALEADRREGPRLMEASKHHARRAATACLRLTGARARNIDIRSAGIEGPSAGLMFALGIVDAIEGGTVSKGRRIAGTGTVAADGRVGRVGNIAEKVSAAEGVGAEIFLAPASQVDEARVAAISVRVLGVDSLDEALRALGADGCRG